MMASLILFALELCGLLVVLGLTFAIFLGIKTMWKLARKENLL